MAQPSWAGNFDCTECGRKRLLGSAFSGKSLEKRRIDPKAPLKCK
eukprot:gene5757-5690_t